MAKGTGITSPVLGNYAKLAEFYLKGKMQVIGIQQEIEKVRGEQLGELSEAIKQRSATGVAELDNLYTSAGELMTQKLMGDHNANRAGAMSLGQVAANRTSYLNQLRIYTNSAQIVRDRFDELNEGVQDGSISGYSLNKFRRGYFDDPNFAGLDVDGTRITPSALSLEFIGDQLNQRKTYEYINADGEKEVKNHLIPVTHLVSPQPIMFENIDVNKYVKDFTSTIGDRVASISASGTVGYNVDEEYRSDPMGFLRRYASSERLPDITNTIENELNSFVSDPKRVLSVLFSEFNAGALGDANKKKEYNQQEIDKLFGSYEDLNGVPRSRFYDENGIPLTFNSDPTAIELDATGNEVVSEQQTQLVKAMLRDRILKSFDVDAKDLQNMNKKKDEKPKPQTLFASLSPQLRTTPTGTRSLNIDDLEYFSALSHYTKIDDVNELIKARRDYQINGKINLEGVQVSGVLGQITDRSQGFTSNHIYGISLGEEANKNIFKDVSLTSESGFKLDNARTMVSVDKPGSVPYIIVVGDSVIAKSVDDYTSRTGTTSGAISELGMVSNEQVVVENAAVLTESQAASVFNKLYNESIKDPQKPFQKFLEEQEFYGGINANHGRWGDGAKLKALALYIKSKNPIKKP